MALPFRTGHRGRRPLQYFGQLPTAAKSLRSVLFFTSYLSTTLFSFANSSFLTPHFSLPLVHFALKSY